MTQRKPGEDFNNYKLRLKLEQLIGKQIMKGKMVWDSNKKGTYRKEVK